MQHAVEVTCHHLDQYWLISLVHTCTSWDFKTEPKQTWWLTVIHQVVLGKIFLAIPLEFITKLIQLKQFQLVLSELARGMVWGACIFQIVFFHGMSIDLTHWPLGNSNEILDTYNVLFKLIFVNDGWGISYEIVLTWTPQNLSDDKSILVQVMAWCRQATSHYLSQCWLRSMSPYGVTRPLRVKFTAKLADIRLLISLRMYLLHIIILCWIWLHAAHVLICRKPINVT